MHLILFTGVKIAFLDFTQNPSNYFLMCGFASISILVLLTLRTIRFSFIQVITLSISSIKLFWNVWDSLATPIEQMWQIVDHQKEEQFAQSAT